MEEQTLRSDATLPELLSREMKGRHLSQRAMARLLEVSLSTLHSWLHGARFPRPEKIPQLVRKLDVGQLGTVTRAQMDESESTCRGLSKVLSDPRVPETAKAWLLAKVKQALADCTRAKSGIPVVVPIAGWQAKLLPDRLAARLAARAIDEAHEAGFREFIVVAAPFQKSGLLREFAALTQSAQDHGHQAREAHGTWIDGRKVRVSTQKFPGIGGALRSASEHVLERSLLLVYCDEVAGPAFLRRLLSVYQETEGCQVALGFRKLRRGEHRESWGMVGTTRRGAAYRIDSIVEKPGPGATRIGHTPVYGRFLLAPSVTLELQHTEDFTTVLRQFVTRQQAYGALATHVRSISDLLHHAKDQIEREVERFLS